MQDKFEFCDEIPDDLKCGLCLQLMVQPRILSCTHGFCFKCINNEACFQCGSDVSLEDLIRSSEAETRIESLKVKCSFIGCNEEICNKDMKEHRKCCQFGSKNGISTEFGCKEMLSKYASVNHTNDEMEPHSTSTISMIKELNEKNQHFETKFTTAMEHIQSLEINQASLMNSVSELDTSHKQVLEGLQILVNEQYSNISEIENLKQEKSTYEVNMMYMISQKDKLEKKLETSERSSQILRDNLKELTNAKMQLSKNLNLHNTVNNEEVTKLKEENGKLMEMLKELRKEKKDLQNKCKKVEKDDDSNWRPSLNGNMGSENRNSKLKNYELNHPIKFELKFENPMSWPINNMKTLTTKKSLWSFSFYIDGGYKVQMGLQVLETEFKLKFRIMKGENDEYLEWPCRKKIIVSLRSNKILKDPITQRTFFIDHIEMDSTQFQKPVKLFNKEMCHSEPMKMSDLIIDSTNNTTRLLVKSRISSI